MKLNDFESSDELEGLNDADFDDLIKDFHKLSDRHVAVFEAFAYKCEIAQVLDLSNRLRIAGNDLVFEMHKRLDQMKRTKKYRNLIRLYNSTNDKGKRKEYAKQLEDLYKQFNVTWEHCRLSMQEIRKKYGIDSVFALTRAEDVWRGVQKCLYSTGKYLHYMSKGEYPVIRAKQLDRGLPIYQYNNAFYVGLGKDLMFQPILKDRFLREEAASIVNYLRNPSDVDAKAIYEAVNGNIISTYRPCYASLVIKIIRNKPRLFIHLTIEGTPLPKYNRKGELRNQRGIGDIGIDVGTQTIAVTSNSAVVLSNLAERGSSIHENELKEKRLYRAMERSRRVNNPNNYNSDGTVKNGSHVWKKSKRYLRLQYKHKELCRKNSLNRHYAINEDVNIIRSLGDLIITEHKNAKQLMKRAKLQQNPDGTYKRRRRFGRSIRNRCPGYFQAQCKKVFQATGGKYIEVSSNYRASQYDHTANAYIKKGLSARMFALSNGDVVQRDLYSSFLLYNFTGDKDTPDLKSCHATWGSFKRMHDDEINRIKNNKIKVMNSGIAV